MKPMTFDQVVRNYEGAMLNRAKKRCLDGSVDPEEAVQEAWIALWAAWDKVDWTRGFTAFLFRILDQAVTMLWRRVKGKNGDGNYRRRLQFVPLEEWEIPSVGPAQESAVELKRVAAIVERIKQPLVRDTLVEVALGARAYEIAAREGVSQQAVAQRVTRGRAIVESELRRGDRLTR